MFHTVYCSFESTSNGRDYLGKHSSRDPYDGYLGSFKDSLFEPDSKIILAYAKDPQGAIWLEMMFQRVFNVVEDPSFANKAYQTSTGFDTTGLSTPKSEEHKRKIASAISGENHPRYGKPGTRLGAKTPEEVKVKISQTLAGRKRSKESCEKQSKTISGSGSHLYGKTGDKHPSYGLQWWFNPVTKVAAKFKDCPGLEWRRGRK
jgi:hypothetical protein